MRKFTRVSLTCSSDGTVKAVKWYPAGATTNSGAGVKETDLDVVLPTLQAMAEVR